MNGTYFYLAIVLVVFDSQWGSANHSQASQAIRPFKLMPLRLSVFRKREGEPTGEEMFNNKTVFWLRLFATLKPSDPYFVGNSCCADEYLGL